MPNPPDFAIVVPMANESGDFQPFADVLTAVLDKIGGGRVYFVVDEVSRDNTLDLCRELADRDPRYRVVWAPENTRAAIFDAIRRKETYGTSGPLMRVRFFGGWNYASDLDEDKKFVEKAYKSGVPMGGDLPAKPAKSKAPTFAVWAQKDPESGNLDRVQIVKGWFANGHPWEKIYDVAWSDNRKPDPKTGKLPPVGNTVNIEKASYTNNIGDTQLSAVWTDPDFKPEHHAVYYVRVLEIPTPRWSTYDAASLGIPVPDGVPATIQERAWSSPIWYTPDPSLVKKWSFYPGLQPGINN